MSNKRKKSKKKNKKFSILSFLFSLFLIAIIFICGLFAYYFVKEDFDFQRALSRLSNTLSINPKPTTVLLLGVSTDIDTELSDTIMICSYNPKKQTSYILSIPRDTFIGENQKNAKGTDKINSLYTRKGPREMMNKLEDITGLDIDYYVVVKNDALIDIVNSIGGVEYNVPIDMNYDDITQNLHIHLDSGMQHIDGEKAEQLLRFRHNNDGTSYPSSYGDNDFGRMRTQREFMIETAKQTIKFKNVLKLKEITKTIYDNVETDMSLFTAMRYVPSAINFNTDNIENYQLPGDSKKLNSLWFFLHDQEKTNELVNTIKENMK